VGGSEERRETRKRGREGDRGREGKVS